MRSKNKTGSPAPWSAEKALPYLASLCAKCEQCEEDLRLKMRRHCMEEGDMDSIIAYLYEHKFLDEERYARAYARDKMRFNGWGKQKISLMLRAKRMPGDVIKDALRSLDSEEYRKTAETLVRRLCRSLNADDFGERSKLLRRMYARGFETALVRDIIASRREEEEVHE